MSFPSSLKTWSAAAVMATFGVGSAQAATLDVGHDLQVAYYTLNGVRSNTSTYSTDLVGSVVTAQYTDGSTETMTWFRKSEWSAGIVSAGLQIATRWWGFDLSTTNRLQSLAFDLSPSGTIFDALAGTSPDTDTPTTKGGIPLHLNAYGSTSEADTSIRGEVTAEYSGLVQMVGHAPGQDAFTRLLIDFSATDGGGLLGGVTLALDMDVLVGGAGDLAPVPLPPGILLLLAGLGAFGLMQIAQTPRRAVAPATA